MRVESLLRRSRPALAAAILLSASWGADVSRARQPTVAPPPIATPTPTLTLAELPPCHPGDPDQAKSDVAVVNAASQALNTGGYGALQGHIDALKAALSHAPTDQAPVERCGDDIVMREADIAEFIALSPLYGRLLAGQPHPGKVTLEVSPYPMASFLLGLFDDEHEDFAAGYAALSIGNRLAPGNPGLASETALALARLSRWDQSLAVCDRALKTNPLIAAAQQARLQRGRGFALEGENRLDEAEAAYRASLELDAANPVALNELRYIADRRRGAPETRINMTHPTLPAMPPN